MKQIIKKLLREGLLREGDYRGILKNKLKLSDKLAEELHKLSDKYSIWFGNHLKSYESDIINSFGSRVTDDIINKKLIEIFDNEREEYQKILTLLKTDNRPKININSMNFTEMLNLYNLYSQSIKDWLEGDGNPNIRNISWGEAEQLSNRWHDNLSTGGELSSGIMNDKDKIIHKFNDGFMWVLHKSNKCDLSKKSMGHCGTATNPNMYLLRLIKGNEEFITADWDPNDKYIVQLKGKGNKKPVERYHKYILWLIVEWGEVDELRTDSGYSTETNFQLSDLTPEEFNYVVKNRPNIFDSHSIKNFFYSLYDKNDKSFDNLKNTIENLINDDNFINNVNMLWVLEIIRYAKNDKINLANTFIEKLIENDFFNKNEINTESFIIYALLTIAKSYNNPIKLLQSYPSDKLFEKLVVDEYLDSFLYGISNNFTNKKLSTLIIDYLIKDDRYLDDYTIPTFFEYVDDSYKEVLINKVKEHYNQKNELLPFTVKMAIKDNSVNGTSEVAESIKITLKRLIK